MQKNQMELVAINRWDDASKVKSFIKEFKLTMPVVMSGKGSNDADKAFGIMGSPTNVLIDSSGKVAAVFEGFDEKGLLAALAKLGFKE
jgi:hypothetical protein